MTGLEKMAAEQDEMIKIAEQQLEDLQDRAIEVAKVIMGFGGKQQHSVQLIAAASVGRAAAGWKAMAELLVLLLLLLLQLQHTVAIAASPNPPEGTWEKVLLTDAVATGARCL